VVIAPVSVSMVGFAMSIVFLATFAFAVAPSWTLRRADLGMVLRNGRNDGNRRTRDWRHMLVILQMAAAVIVSISAAALTRGVQHLRRFDPGYQTTGLLAVHVNSVTGTADRREVFVNELRSALRNVPGVTNTGFGLWPLLGFDTDRPGSQRRIRIVGRDAEQRVAHDIVDAGYFSTLGVHIVAGRDFDPRDAVNASRQVVINQAMAKSLWPAESPVGAQVILLPEGQPPKQAEIIGVVGDFMTDAAGIGRIAPRIFVGYDRWTPVMFSTLYVRVDRESSAGVAAIRRAIMAVSGPSAKQPDISTMDQARERAIAPYRLALFGVALLAGIALLLAVGGLYGLVSYLVTGRTREFGIRIALGAHGTDIVRLVIGDALIPVAAGALLGLGGAVAAVRAMPLLSELMFRSGPLDPYVLGVTTIGLIVIALMASVMPARRAFNIQPTEALRAE
jgi:predicted permease